jgi:adenine specific DNA methylase Mod
MKKIFELENKISRIIYSKTQCTAHFDYFDSTGVNKKHVNISTYNELKEEIFLLGEFKAKNKEEVLNKALEYLTKNDSSEKSYTVIWSKKINGKGENHKKYTSHFSAKNLNDLLKKISYGKYSITELEIYEIKLNPLT